MSQTKPNQTKPSNEKKLGHAVHTQAADEKGLPGVLPRKIKVAFIGAGSGFTPRVINDLLKIPGQIGGTIALVDIDKKRLATMTRLVKKMISQAGASAWKVVASPNRREVLAGSDYIINCVEVNGLECVRFDNDIPAKYGVTQCIGDTIGPGGLFKGLRTIPVFLDLLRDCEKLCPATIVLNYTNPMNMMCLAAGRTSPVQMVGLCHSVQTTSHLLAKRAGIPYEEMKWRCAGINHLAWFVELTHREKDLYPLLKKKARQDILGKPSDPEDAYDLVRKDMMLQFGAFITESSGHLSEYLPYYRKSEAAGKKYLRPDYHGDANFYSNNWPTWRANRDKDQAAMLAGNQPIEWPRSWEYASWIIEAREKNTPLRIHGNVMNSVNGSASLISNLSADGCVEVACMVDQNGVQPCRFGALPAQMAAVCESNMRMFGLAATAVIERSKEAAIHALMLDPLTAAVCSPADIRDMTLEMFAVEKAFLPEYR